MVIGLKSIIHGQKVFKGLCISLLILILASCTGNDKRLDKSGFVELPGGTNILLELRYLGNDNFLGKRVDGYEENLSYVTKEAFTQLLKVNEELNAQGLGLKVFDAYRPQRAVDHFVRWGSDLKDTLTKWKYYPDISKDQVFELGFVATKSGHSRGSTIDLTIVRLEDSTELDMGSIFDFFGEPSHHSYPHIDSAQLSHRQMLKLTMEKYNFKPYSNEWWHYTLANEPYPETYFDFPINRDKP